MVRNSEKRKNRASKETETRDKLEDDVDALFGLPLAEFIAARKTLAARLKQAGRGNEADRVKALVKPSISAWAVNQLYWKHREAFDRLIATGQLCRNAQTSGLAGKVTEMRKALDVRREALSELARLATALLGAAGHNPTPDTMLRITATLEAMSAYASLADAPSPGRLTHDVDPPGFESLGSLNPGAGMMKRTAEPSRVARPQKSVSTATNKRPKAAPDRNMRQREEMRQARIAAAKVSLQDARRVLIAVRARSQSAEAAQKKANADATEAEKHQRAAEQRCERARAAAEDAARRARTLMAEVEEAVKAVEDAERTVENRKSQD
jgi:hypothetical protein